MTNSHDGDILWTHRIDRETYSGVGYITNLIPAAVAKNYGDPLKPEVMCAAVIAL